MTYSYEDRQAYYKEKREALVRRKNETKEKKRLRKSGVERAEKIHAKKRAAERYNLVYDESLLAQIQEKIAASKYHNAKGLSNTRTYFDMTLSVDDRPSVRVKLVYDKKRHTVATFLPIICHPPRASQGRRRRQQT